MNIYCYSNLSSARTILSNRKTLDRFNKPLFNNSFILWAKKVIKFFKKLYAVAYRLKSQSMNWGKCLSYAWQAIKSSLVSYRTYLTAIYRNGVVLLNAVKYFSPSMKKNTKRYFSKSY